MDPMMNTFVVPKLAQAGQPTQDTQDGARRYSLAQWEEQKHIIRKLYVEETHKLKDVIAILGSSGFIVTEKQLKTRLRKWGFDTKYVRERNMIAIARTRLHRKAFQNKDSSFRVNKRTIQNTDINRFLKRKNISDDMLVSMASPSNVSSPTFSVYTPRSLTPDRNQVVPLASYCPTMPPAPSATPFHDSSYATSLGAPISASPSSLPSFSWAHQTSTSFTGGSQNPFLLPQDTEHEGKSDTWVSVCQQSPRQVEDQSTVDQNPLVLRPRTDTSFDLDSLNATEDSLGHRMVGSAAPTHKKRHLHKVRGRRGTGILKPMQRPSTQSLRYLRQNDCDEEMHIILDCITPYYNHCFRGGKWKLGADYLYDEFTQYIGLAIVSFSQAGPRGFGFALQQAFISLEPLILNESLWGLERIFYAVSGLTASGFMDVVQSLLTHSCNLASGKFERLHPMIQILKRFAVLSDKDPAFFAHSILTVWRLCHSIMNTDKVNSILLFHNRKCFWKDIRNWPAEEQTTRNLRLFLEKVEKDFGEYNDIAMVIYDELVAIDSQFHRDKLEQTALEMLRRARVRLRHGKLSGELVSWYRNANYELAWFYYSSGKIQSAIEHLRQVIPDRTETRWESDQFDILQGWLMES